MLSADDWFVLGESTLSKSDLDYLNEKYPDISIHASVLKGGVLYHDAKISIFIMEGLSESVRLFTANNVPDNSYFCFSSTWSGYTEKGLERQINFFEEVTKYRFPRDRLIHLANEHASLEVAKKLGLVNSIFCNHNAWIDFNTFKIIGGKKRQFRMAMNCRPELFKRPFLAKNINGLVVIKGANYNPSNFYDLGQLNPKYMNASRISPVEVNDLLNQAYCGGIFSEIEGACFASSEYLLAGLPVVSTKSIGGRDYWYNENNSIICEATPESVKDAVDLAIENLQTGVFDRHYIREQHIKSALQLRNDFSILLQGLFDRHNCDVESHYILKSYCYGGSFFKKTKYPYYAQ